MRYLLLFTFLFVTACSGQTKEELAQEGADLAAAGNYRGAIVLYRNALEKDADYLAARKGLADVYLKSGKFSQAEKEYQKIILQNPSMAEIRLDLASAYIQLKEPEKALLELDAYHSSNKETVESLVLYGRAHGAAGDLSSAENFFQKAMVLDPQAVDPYLYLGRMSAQRHDFDKAKQYLQKAVDIDKKEDQAYYLLADIYVREGDRQNALKTYLLLSHEVPKQLQAYYMACILQIDLNDIPGAEETLQRLREKFPSAAESSRLKGILLYRQGDFDQAKVALEESLKKERHVLSYFFLGLSYYAQEQYELALNQFQNALDLNPDFERGRLLVATTLVKQKRLDDAVIEVQKVLRADPKNAYAHNILGSAYLAQGEYDKGMAELDRAIDLDSSLADAHIRRGLFHLSKGEGAEGEADLIKAVEAAPEVLNGRLMLVSHYLRKKNYSAAIQTLQDGLNGSKEDSLLYNYLAAAYFSQKKNDLAVSALMKAKQADSHYLTPYFTLAAFYSSQSQYEKAVAEYRQILTADGQNVRALLGLAGIYRIQGQKSELESTYQSLENTRTEEGFYYAAQYQLKIGHKAEALAVIDRGLQVFPDSIPMLEIKGALSFEMRDVAQAQAAYERMASVDPERGYGLLMRLYLSTRQSGQAEKMVQDLMTSDSGKEYPYLLKAGLLRSQQKTDEALSVLQAGIDSLAKPVRLKMQLARLSEEQGNSAQAEQIYQQVINQEDNYAPAYVALGVLREQSGDKAAALDDYRKAVKYDPKNVPALNNLAYLLADNFGESEEGLSYALMAFRLEPNDPRIMDTLGYLLLLNERYGDAVKVLDRAYQMLPKESAVALHLAQALLAAGEKEKGRGLLQDVLRNGSAQEKAQAKTILNRQ